ncbi:MAG TPA: flagellar biosynthesis anti-sigma factor FlgM [Alloacidobacterium sp.]|nr:flagellar biosynthesis anti-sigma factor FlgM [Alloacidobacterium sp.]
MNVNDGLHGLPEALGVSQASPVSAVQPQQQTASSATANNIQDRTEVSTAASLAHQAMSVPDVRMEKVAAIQQALANGTYQVGPADVADKLVRQMMGE